MKWFTSMLHELPDEMKSRKVLLILLTMIALLFLAIIGTVLAIFTSLDTSLFKEAMLYITGAGTGGAVAQAVPDAIQANNGTYRPTAAPMYTPGVLTPSPSAPVQPSAPIQPPTPEASPTAPPSYFGRP